MSERYLCLHGHFYQPPRENPWLGVIETQPSARPYHDWNERITRECYAPMGRSRVLGDGQGIARIMNNYEHMSFNFGPTLIGWLERHSPRTYAWILEGDRASRRRYHGHGNALAQVFNHIIMPLANQRDRLTQIRWGLYDFRRRFGRPAEGLWLAEAAVDQKTMRLMVQEGVRFTVLSPDQAQAVRALTGRKAGEQWVEVTGGRVDPRRPYRVFLDRPGRLYLDVFFYDGPVSRAVAYERLLASGAGFLDRLEGAFGQQADWPRLVNIATDGESYGHHFKFGDMALSWVFDRLEKDGQIKLINYGAFLELFPPQAEARVIENSSWSCAHGVERWRSDCGCHVGGGEGWNQAWRTPLREGLDWLRDMLADLFEARGGRLLKDPWAARDDYISVLSAPGPGTREDFLRRHAVRELDREEKVEVFRLMESQLMSLYMFTSCGWFFDDIAGLEPIQNLKYAARAIELVREWAVRDLEAGLLKFLSQAVPNMKKYKSGAEVYRREVAPSLLGASRTVAHFVLGGLVDEARVGDCAAARLVKPIKTRRLSEAGLTVFFGRAEVVEETTGRTARRSFAALDQGGAALTCRVSREELDPAGLTAEVQAALEEAAAARLLDIFERVLPAGRRFTLDDLIPDTRIRLVRTRAAGFFNRLRAWVLENYAANWEVLSLFRETGEPMPFIEEFLFRTVVGQRLAELLEEGREPGRLDVEALRTLASQAKDWGVVPEEPGLMAMIRDFLLEKFDQVRQDPGAGGLEDLVGFFRLARDYDRRPDLWESQNIYFELRNDQEFLGRLGPEARKTFQALEREMEFLSVTEPLQAGKPRPDTGDGHD
ncbi:MAG: DUF3536 domain-containing protein [Thermodesulfobacteriota bacterium]